MTSDQISTRTGVTIEPMRTVGDVAARFCATLVDEWARSGVHHAMIAPGSRSTPMALQIFQRADITTHVFHDERSAAFAALGVGLASGVPALLLCTSGTAATHFHAAVVEAGLSAVPMIVLTADRPSELRDVGAPQTIDQTQLYGSAVRWFHDPGVPSDDVSHTWRALATRAFQETLHAVPGPVHLNLPFREPLVGTATNVPEPRTAAWNVAQVGRTFSGDIDQIASQLSGRRGVIIAGKGATNGVADLARALGWPVCADARSDLRREENADVALSHSDGVLRAAEFVSRHQPEVIIRVGESPASKVTAQWMASCEAEIWHIGNDARVMDPDHLVSQRFVCDVESFVNDLAKTVRSVDQSWLHSWITADRGAHSAIETWCASYWSEPTIARVVTKSAKAVSNIVVSSSMPIRDVEWYGDRTTDVRVFSNRGANGIDGVISTAVGIAIATQAPTTILIGDVAFLHDVNGLIGIGTRGVDVRCVVVNNNGGSIFSFLPQAAVLQNGTFEALYGTPHDVHIESLAHAYGLKFVRATQADALTSALDESGPIIIEACTDRSMNVAQHEELNAAIVTAVHATL